jgi:flagella basal body P-ring formation protein FlgA
MKTRFSIVSLLCVLAFAGTANADLRKDLHDALYQALEDAVNDSTATIQVKDLTISREALLARARRVQHVDLLRGERPSGKVTARAELVLKDGTKSFVFVMADVDVRVPVWVVQKRIGPGTPLNEMAIAAELRSVAGLGVNVLRTSVPLTGRVAARTLVPGTLLTRTALTTPRLVRRGESVTVQVRNGRVLIRARGRALAAGRLGDLIRVRLDDGKKVLSARVEGPNQVSVKP